MESIINDLDRECCHCYVPTTERHHIMNGNPNRKYSEQDGLWIYVCSEYHAYIHKNQDVDNRLKAKAEWIWLQHNNATLDDWMRRYHKNYLELDEHGKPKDPGRY